MAHMGIAEVNTKLFINEKLDKESRHCSSNPCSNMGASCHHHRTESIFPVPRLHIFGLITFCGYSMPLCSNRVQKRYSGTRVKVHSGSPFR